MTWCRTIRKRLGAYHDGELGGRWREKVRHHVGRCAACDAALETLRRLDELAQKHGTVPPVHPAEWENRWERIRVGIRTQEEPAARIRMGEVAPLWKRWVWAAAATAVVVGILVAGLLVVPVPRQEAAVPNCIVTLVETDIENSSVLYYHCKATDLTVITLIPAMNRSGADYEAKGKI